MSSVRSMKGINARNDANREQFGRHRQFSMSRAFVKGVVGFFTLQYAWILWGFTTLTGLDDNDPFWILSEPHLQPLRSTPTPLQPSGHFNGYAVFFHDLTKNTSYHSRPYTSLHCVGENYQGGDAWMQRSCHFRFLCFNVSSREFEVYLRPVDNSLQEMVTLPKDNHHPLLMDMTSSVLHDPSATASTIFLEDGTSVNSVSLGGIRPEWIPFSNDKHPLKWFPRVVNSVPPDKYYALEEHVIFTPFQSTGAWDPSRLLWDDFFPIFNLLHMFQLAEVNGDDLYREPRYKQQPLLMRMVSEESALPGACDDENFGKNQQCVETMNTFRQLIGHSKNELSHISTQLEATLRLFDEEAAPESNLVCAKNGVAGMGPLTSRGVRNLVQGRQTTKSGNNLGRGGLFWRFRNYCLYNMGISNREAEAVQTKPSIITMIRTSESNVDKYVNAVKARFSTNSMVQIENVDTDQAIISDMINTVSRTRILVSTMSEATLLALFLPKGAHIVILRSSNNNDDDENVVKEDLLMNLSHLVFHRLSIKDVDNAAEAAYLVDVLDRLINR
ncbi:hypothetical protein IV203_003354 [Nitzschia inconspicua]|uniref:Glycosyltransferase n=1 Tax=Nitzschia inconspicua TaxID=303405 RepID=A0A9K3PNM3_9STRA|nr:hypothetical protein IV203_017546 [Nitzschia inconspicua]KAG7353998.1 hypothetical protein IV203_003354 [Nitzschia inconspicua]